MRTVLKDWSVTQSRDVLARVVLKLHEKGGECGLHKRENVVGVLLAGLTLSEVDMAIIATTGRRE